METIKDQSYGVVPVRNEDGVWKVFVLHQISKENTYWTFPKGHPEGEEDAVAAALRELKEETGMVPQDLDTMQSFKQVYHFVRDGVEIEKHATYFVGYIDGPKYTLQPEEVLEARWCTFDEAEVLLTYDMARETLGEVARYLANKE